MDRAEYMRVFRVRTGRTEAMLVPLSILAVAMHESSELNRFLGKDMCIAINDWYGDDPDQD